MNLNLYGKVIVIKRNGVDGAHFPLTATCCLFGRSLDSDIRIQLPTVDQSQCQIEIDDEGHVFMRNMSNSSPTLLNNKVLSNQLTPLSHGDFITIVDRQFRFEFPPGSRFVLQKPKSPKAKSPKTPASKAQSPGKLTPLAKSPKSRSSISKPLSPLSDNVPAVASPKSSKKSRSPKKQPTTPVVSPANKSHVGFSPTSFYKSPQLPKKSTENVFKVSASPVTKRSSSPKSPAKRVSTGSPFPKGNASLRKSISELRRRSVPVFEKEEMSSPVLLATPAAVATPASQRKRKSHEFAQPSTKRKRVSFGPNLSPEHFDKTLPPKTPVKRGATPRLDAERSRSLLKRKSLSKSSKASPSASRKSRSPASVKSRSPSPKSKTPIKTAKASPSPRVSSAGKNSPKTPATPASDNSFIAATPKGLARQSSPSPARGTPHAKSKISPKTTPSSKASPAKKIATPAQKIARKSISTPDLTEIGKTVKSPSSARKSTIPVQVARKSVSTPDLAIRSSSPTQNKSRTPPSAKKTVISVGTGTPASVKAEKKGRSPSPAKRVGTPKKGTPTPAGKKDRSPSPAKKVSTPIQMVLTTITTTPASIKTGRKSRSPVKKVATPKKSTPSPVGNKNRSPSPAKKVATPKKSTPSSDGKKNRSPSPAKKVATPKKSTPSSDGKKNRSPSPAKKVATPKKSTPSSDGKKNRSPSPAKKVATPKKSTPSSDGKKNRSPSPAKKVATPIQIIEAASLSSKKITPTPIGRKSMTPSPTKKVRTPISKSAGKIVASAKAKPNVKTPSSVTFASTPSSVNPSSSKPRRFADTPMPVLSPSKRVHSPKRFFGDDLLSSPSRKMTPASKAPIQTTPKSGKKSTGKRSSKKLLEKIAMYQSPGDKIVAPPQDINKVVALRAIHGVTPKLSSLQISTQKKTPKSLKKVKTWSDVVRLGASTSSNVPAAVRPVPKAYKAPAQKASPKIKKTFGKTPKTPRALARALAPTTGHIDSPATILVGKKISRKTKLKTPKALPKKGRKVSMSKSRKSMGNTSFSGVQEMFNSPEPKSILNESALYADIPDTPNGPNEMIVSPLSGRKSGSKTSLGAQKQLSASKRKSAGAGTSGGKKSNGVQPKRKSAPSGLTGVARLFKTPKMKGRKSFANASVLDLQELFSPVQTKTSSQSKKKTPQATGATSKVSRKSVSLVGVKELLKVNETQAETNYVGVKNLMKTPKVKNAPASPSGLDQLFKTPKGMTPPVLKPSTTAKSARKAKSPPKPLKATSPSPLKSPKQRGSKKRKGDEIQSAVSPKKTKISEPSPAKPRSTRRGVPAVEKKASPAKSPAKRGGRSKGPQKTASPAKLVVQAVTPLKGRKRKAEQVLDPVILISPLAKRGRQAQKSKITEKAASPKPTGKKSRRGKSPSPVAASPKKATRTRTKTATKAQISQVIPEETLVAKLISPKKRGAKAATAKKAVTPKVMTPTKPASKSKGRAATAAPDVLPSPPAKRGRQTQKSKTALKAASPKPTVKSPSPVKASPKKATRTRTKVKVSEVTPKLKTPSPAKPASRRRGAAVAPVVLASPPAKRGRQAQKSKAALKAASPKPIGKSSSPVKASPKKATRTRTKTATKVQVSEVVQEDNLAVTLPSPKKRGARATIAKKAATLKVKTPSPAKPASRRRGATATAEKKVATPKSKRASTKQNDKAASSTKTTQKVSPVKSKGKKVATAKTVMFTSPAKAMSSKAKSANASPAVARRSTRRR